MHTKRTLLVTSSSALAAGVAQAAIQYSGPVNTVVPLPPTPQTGAYFDLNNDGILDFGFGFDGFNTANHQKPFISGYPADTINGSSAVLARLYPPYDNSGTTVTNAYGLPATVFGTMIDQNYLAPNLSSDHVNRSYFDQNGDGKYVGDFVTGAKTRGYIGLELFNLSLSATNYGWAQFIFDDTTNPATLTLLDYAYEDSNGVGIIAGATNTVGAPAIYSQPQSQMVGVGGNAQMSVTVLAKPAPYYQWKAGSIGSHVYTNLNNSGPISGANASNLVINGASPANMLDYIVVVTNALGAATSSPPATLTVVTPVATPTPQVLFGGLTGHFQVNVASGLSATYRWRQNGVNLSDNGRITGATTPRLAVGNLQSTDAGSYDVVLTMGSVSATSTVATLAILPVSSESTYEAAMAAAQPFAYYRLNDTSNPATGTAVAYDNAGGYNGLYGLDVTNGVGGVAGPRPGDGFPGFAVNNYASLTITNDPVSLITLAPWLLNTNTATFTAWVNPADLDQQEMAGVVMTGTTNGSFAGIRYFWQANGTSGYRDVAYAWNEITGASSFWDSGFLPPPNQWSFVGVVVTPRNTTLYVFNTNGISSAVCDGTATGVFAPFTNQVMSFNTPEYIGTNPDGPLGTRNFNGTIDEVAVFNRALGSNDLQVLYDASLGLLPPVQLQVGRVGTNVQLTWGTLGRLLEASSVKGPWTTNSLAASPYTVSPTSSQKYYRVLVP
jgi:hypothetical protein